MPSQTILLILLAAVIIAIALGGAVLVVKLVANSTRAGLVAIGIMLLAVTGILLDSFIIIDSNYRDGREIYVSLSAASAPFCECHSTRSGDQVTTTCTPPDCSKSSH